MPIDLQPYAEALYPEDAGAKGGDAKYQAWLTKYGVHESQDYDTKAAFEAGIKPDENGHLDDEFKLPNHITYSTESRASKAKDAPPAGTWSKAEGGHWKFQATETNVDNAGGVNALKAYFDANEPGNVLVLPDGKIYMAKAKESEK